MKIALALIATTFTFTNLAHASGTPFSGFLGKYTVTSGECVDLVASRKYQAEIKTIEVVDSQNNREAVILAHGENNQQEHILSESAGASFSGDGISTASWTHSFEQTGFSFLLKHSISKDEAGAIRFQHEYKYFERRENVPAHDSHIQCEFSLRK